ncbi:ATP-binding cassette, subfamily B (MDR/TAP),member 1 [Rhizoctonia solani AG-1 IB]|uniref:ATP-binding cassette, subfamily B (MDR/TAP),member 1 n=2 Tax=Thanatephorus cucumeris (strain AG1-IB / isolate 7/3/14) TaxID=1108050 RepID=M5C561_THACB|nr:ATP-binding cassette, subfamily B (MDR/TAP),member 1 [Rhizoctonia solani AG-1 IB]
MELTKQDNTRNTSSRRPQHSGPAFFYAFTYADRADWLLYGVGGVAAIISGAGFPVLDLVYGYWTTALVSVDMTPSSLRGTTNTMAGVCLGIGILQFITGSIFLSCFTIASGRTTDRLRRAYLDSVLHQDAEFFEKVGPGEVGTRMIKDVGTIKTATGEKLGFMVWALTTLVVALIMAFSRAARLAGVVFGVVPLAFILFISSGYLAAKADARLLDVEGQAGTLLEQILSSVRVVQSFAAESFLVKKYDQYLDQLQRLGKWRSIVRGLELSISYCILNLTYSVAFWYGSQLIVRDNLEVGLMFTVFWNMFNAIFAIANILPHISAIRDSILISTRIRAEIERVPTIDVRSTKGDELWDSQTGEKINVSIEARNLTFSYPSRPDHKTLDDVSFVLEAGKVTALVGASGSGKSTIASLLLRYYDPSPAEGEKSTGGIFLAGRDIRDLSLPWLRSQIGIIAQDPQLFTASIFENVAYGLSGTPWELPTSELEPNYQERLADAKIRVEYALKQAQAWDFVCKLPEGMDTRIKGGRTGVLSGGQRQRIAAARALIRKPRILLLDEGTSALDAETEQRLMAAIHEEQAQSGMTTILIAHRLSSIQNADRIIAMTNGRVAEQGTYNELMELGGVFSALVRHQASAGQSSPSSEVTVPDSMNKKIETSSATTKFSTPQIPLYRPISTVSVAKTAVDDSMERGLLVKETQTPGLTSRFFRLLSRYGQWILIGVAGSMCIGASFPIAGWLIGSVVEGLSIHGDDEQVLREGRYWAMWFLVLSMVNIVSSFVAGFFLSMGGARIDRRLRLTALSSLLRQEIGFFDQEENAAGSLTAGVASQASHVSAAIGLVWQQLITSGGNFIGAFILGVVLSWKLALPSFAPVPAILVTAYFNIALLEKYEHTLQKPLEDASAFASENVDAIKTVAALGRENLVMEYFDKTSAQKTTKTKYLLGGALGFGFGMGSILILSAILMWWGVELYLTQRIGLKNLYATFEAVLIGAIAASRLFTYIPDMARMIQGFRAICNWEDRKPEVASLDVAKAPALEKVRGEITFTSCTLQYASRPKPAIENLNLVIPAGKSVAFCGPSGGGKSSIISMISRFYDPSMGTISLDGRDIRSIPLEEYRSHISLVAQDAVLYEGTFRENITLGQTSIAQEEIERACRDANILDFIQSLPQGFDSPVGFKGSQMSGGQRQRICIARALLRNPSILLLDEATSALDAESERSVQEALEQASKGRTTISIAHRLSTIQNADIIHVVEDGRIVESGSHAELLAHNGRYVDLVKSQL